MKAVLKSNTPERKLVAVIGSDNKGVFYRHGTGSIYIRGDLSSLWEETLEQLAQNKGRTPVYEGDTIEVTF